MPEDWVDAAGHGLRHLCILTTAHPVDDVRVNSKIACSMAARGVKVTWVGPERSYFSATATPNDDVTYLFTRPTQGRLGRLVAARRAVKTASTLGRVDWWYSPDPDAAYAALWLARRRGGRVVFDIHEVYHGSLIDRWLFGRRLTVIRELTRRAIEHISSRAHLVIGVSGAVLAPYTTESDEVLVVRNCAPLWFAEVIPQPDDASKGALRVMHGKVLPSNGTSRVLDALQIADDCTGHIKVVMSFATSNHESPFVASVKERVRTSLPLQRSVEFVGGVPHEQMPILMSSGSVGMIAYGRGLGEDSLPNRLFEYMAAGLAILAPSYSSEIKVIVDDERIGLTVDFDDPQAIAQALMWFRDHRDETARMGLRARTAFIERHNWEMEANKLFEALER